MRLQLKLTDEENHSGLEYGQLVQVTAIDRTKGIVIVEIDPSRFAPPAAFFGETPE